MDPKLLSTTLARITRALPGDAEKHPSSTLIPAPTTHDDVFRAALEALEQAQSGRGRAARFELDTQLGEGGMGVVWLATQRTLRRAVALKELRAGQRSDAHTLQLLREAWIMGSLEHPNIAPVYDIGLDEEGTPFVVLKRIEGVHWGTLMRDATAVRDRFGANDLLEWNLNVLIDIARALVFAHERGIVHRDVKPENVMIGRLGEVYLVDWGIAVSVKGSDNGRFPVPENERGFAGSLAYMAPEMVDRSAGATSTATDVYLLGAVLYDVLVGRPPHASGQLVDMLASILASKPVLPDDTPEELADLVRRAMSADPTARPDAGAFGAAIRAFLEHRASVALTNEANARLDEIERSLASKHTGSAAIADRYRLFGACRFGFMAALEQWPDNAAAKRGLARATSRMAEHELSVGHPHSARALLAETEVADAILEERIDRAERERAVIERRQKEALLDQDTRVEQRLRRLVAFGWGVVWTVAPPAITAAELATGSHVSYTDLILGSVGWLSLALILYAALGRLRRTRLNRATMLSILVTMSAQLMLQIGACQLGIPAAHTQCLQPILYATAVGTLALMIDWRLWPGAPLFMVGFLCATSWPAYRGFFTGSANLLFTLVVAYIWRSPDAPPVSMRTPPSRR